MTSDKFQPGDRVRLTGKIIGGMSVPAGLTGVVVYRMEDGHIGIQFDEPIKAGHDCGGAKPNFPFFKDGHCRWGNDHQVELIEHGEPIPPLGYMSSKWGKGIVPPEMQPVTDEEVD